MKCLSLLNSAFFNNAKGIQIGKSIFQGKYKYLLMFGCFGSEMVNYVCRSGGYA